MAGKTKTEGADMSGQLDRAIYLLETLVLIAGKGAGIGKEQLRAILKINSSRVSAVTKHMPKG